MNFFYFLVRNGATGIFVYINGKRAMYHSIGYKPYADLEYFSFASADGKDQEFFYDC